jgi:hypothetical protein
LMYSTLGSLVQSLWFRGGIKYPYHLSSHRNNGLWD